MLNKVVVDIPNDPNYRLPEKTSLKFLCFDLSSYSKSIQFISCCLAIFVFYLAYGYLQELIFTLDGFKPYGWYLTLIQFLFYTIFGWCETRLSNIRTRSIPLKIYFFLALLTLGTMGFSNASLGYLNYPTQVIFKCCKLVPVLIGGVLIQGKKYGWFDYLSAICMCTGLAFFILADSETSPNFDPLGVFMISMALLCDAMIGNIQEKAMKSYNATNTEIVLYSYSIGFIYLFIIMGFSGDLLKGFEFCNNHIVPTYGYGFLFSLTGYMGVQAVLCLVKTCGAFTAVTVTTTRKAITIVFSFMFFEKPFVFQYLWSGIIVLLGIYLNVFSKRRPNISLRFILCQLRNYILCNRSRTKHFSAVV